MLRYGMHFLRIALLALATTALCGCPPPRLAADPSADVGAP